MRQVGELLLTSGVTKICPEFDAFLYKHQMNHLKKGVDPKKSGKQQLNAKDADLSVKAFHEACERLLQAATVVIFNTKLIGLRQAETHLVLQHC